MSFYLDCYDSLLLRSVAHCRPERLRKYHNILSSKLTTNADNARILEGLQHWENEIYFNDNYQFISSMWEVNTHFYKYKLYIYCVVMSI